MPIKNPESVLAHAILCGTSGWAMTRTEYANHFAFGTFAYFCVHGVLGVLHHALDNPDAQIVEAFNKSLVVAESVSLPLVNVDIYLMNGMRQEIAFVHAGSAVVPIGLEVASERNERVVDLVVLGNIASLIFVAVSREQPWAAGLAGVAAMNHFALERISENLEVSRPDLVAIGLSLFNIFAVHYMSQI